MQSVWMAVSLAAITFLASGCAKNKVYIADTARNAQLNEDLTKEPFRGRWWNLYERASIFQRYELWADAETDIRAALSRRNTDQRWARTYGIHFTPEYFPNRELGVVLYHQNQYDEAIAHLQTSVAQQYTARAAWYLDRAREARIEAIGEDTEPPVLELVSPVAGVSLGATEVQVQFIARDNHYVKRIFVNDQEIPLLLSQPEVSTQDLEIEHSVVLGPGQNTITIAAADLFDNRVEQKFTIDVDADGPTVQFEDPVVLPGIVQGLAYDPAGIKELFIGEQPVALERISDTTARFRATTPNDNYSFRCSDRLDNETRGLIGSTTTTLLTPQSTPNVQLASARRIEPLSDDVVAVYQGGELIGMIRTAQDSADAGPRVEFANLRNDQTYYKEEVAVVLELDSPVPLKSVTLNGVEVDGIMDDWTSQRVSRRIRLREVGKHTMTVVARDLNNKEKSAEVTITREDPQTKNIERFLQVALLGSFAKTAEPELEQYAEYTKDELERVLDREKRFNVLDRDSIPDVIQEQQVIRALGSKKDRDALGQMKIADYLLIGDLRKHGDNVEILVHAIDSRTSRETIVDVFGPAGDASQLDELTYDLSLRLEQEFPQVQGGIQGISGGGNTLQSTLSRDQRVRKSMYCMVYRPEDQYDGDTHLGTTYTLIAEGTLQDIQRRGSKIELLIDEDSPPGTPPELTDLVLTK